jgi:hypothetical protein
MRPVLGFRTERFRVMKEGKSLTAAEAHKSILACASFFSVGVVVFRACLRISEERREDIRQLA